MNTKRNARIVLISGALIAITFLFGCSSKAPELTKEEQKNFNPGPPGKDVDIAGYMRAHSGKGGPVGGPPPNSGAPAPGRPK